MLRLITAKQNLLRSINNVNNQTLEISKNVSLKFHEKIKGTFMENWVKFWKNLFIDYKAVVVDIEEDIVNKPVKAVWIFTILGSAVYCSKTNPDEVNFRDACLNASTKLALIPPSTQNPAASQYLKTVEKSSNEQKLRRLNIGVASIIWTNYYSDSCHIYQADCPHLQVTYMKFKDQILDVGFLNRWWILNHKMKDYDINY